MQASLRLNNQEHPKLLTPQSTIKQTSNNTDSLQRHLYSIRSHPQVSDTKDMLKY